MDGNEHGFSSNSDFIPVTIERRGNAHFRAASCHLTGRRPAMEDRPAMYCSDRFGFFGVFDGHSGHECAAYCATNLYEAIAQETLPLPDSTLEKLCLDIDKKFLQAFPEDESGTTGSFFVATPHPETYGSYNVQVGNVGDSRVIVGREGKAIPMTCDHTPEVPTEADRIRLYGGHVVRGRIYGVLAVSRAFGDRGFKNESAPTALEQSVTAQPDITHITCSRDDFVLVATDGIFEPDSLKSHQSLVEIIFDSLKESDDPGRALLTLCTEAFERGSKDNITGVLVQFCDGTNFNKPVHEVVHHVRRAKTELNIDIPFLPLLCQAEETPTDGLIPMIPTLEDMQTQPLASSSNSNHESSGQEKRQDTSENAKPSAPTGVKSPRKVYERLYADGLSQMRERDRVFAQNTATRQAAELQEAQALTFTPKVERHRVGRRPSATADTHQRDRQSAPAPKPQLKSKPASVHNARASVANHREPAGSNPTNLVSTAT